MAAPNQSSRVRFSPFEVDLRTGELHKHGHAIRLPDQAFQVLALLLERPGELVSRDELQQKLWPANTFVDFDVGLNSAIKKLRDALDDSAEHPRFIETLPRRGYRFIASVSQVERATSEAQAQPEAPLPKRAHGRLLALITGGVALIALLGFAANSYLRPRNAPAETRQRRLAVLAFQNLSGDPEQEYFSDGITEEMIAHLSRFDPERLAVIARTSAMAYKGSKKTVAEIGNELEVDYILEGSVRRDAGRVRITAQLIQVRGQSHIWAQSYERELRHILPLQREVAADVAREVHLRLSPPEKTQVRSRQEVDPQAYEAYIRGLFLWQRRDKENLEKAMEYFEEALRREPTFAMASVGLARARSVHTILGFGPRAEGAAKAEKAALRALELQPDLGEAYAVLGWLHLSRWEWAKAEETYRRAIELSPNDPIAHLWLGHYLLRVGRFQESLLHRQRAHELDPLDTTVNASLALNLYRVGRKAEALELFEKSRELYTGDPGLSSYHFLVGSYHFQEKDYVQARRELEEAVRLCRRCPIYLARLGHILAVSGNRTQAEEISKELQTRSRREFISPFHGAIVHAGLGELNQAFDLLEKAYGERDFQLFSLREEPFLLPLRSDPRFHDLLRRMNLPPASSP